MSLAIHFVNSDKGANLTVYLDGKVIRVSESHECFTEIVNALNELKAGTITSEEFLALSDAKLAVKKFVQDTSDGRATIDDDGNIVLDGEVQNPAISSRAIELKRAGLPFSHLLNFCEQVRKNPSYAARHELFDFLDSEDLPILEDGWFVAYKAVRPDFTDKRTGAIDNSPGSRVTMERYEVDDDRGHSCSSGLHVGALSYAKSFAQEGDKILVVKVNPAEVVSVPIDSGCRKMRTCEYVVLRELEYELKDKVYDEDGVNPVRATWPEHVMDYNWADDNYYDDDDDYYKDEFGGADTDDYSAKEVQEGTSKGDGAGVENVFLNSLRKWLNN